MWTFNQIPILLLAAGTTFAQWTATHCTDPAAANAAQDPTYRWRTMDTDTAWAAAVANWKANEAAGGLTFVESVSNFFHGPEQMECNILGVNNNCLGLDIVCNDNTGPPGTFILNAIKSIASINNNMYTAINAALPSIEANVGNFATTFSPIPPPDKTVSILLDVLGLGFAMSVAPLWNIALKESAFFKGLSNELGTLKDSVNPMVSYGITIAKDTSTASQEIVVANELSANVGAMVEIWRKSIAQMNDNLFNGSDQSIAVLQGMITDGKMIAANVQISQDDVMTTIEKVIYAQIMPQAWSLSPDELTPFILDTQVSCETAIDMPQYIPDPNAPNTWSCNNDRLYYLKAIGAPYQVQLSSDSATNLVAPGGLPDLPGLGSLGNGNWAGLTIGDLVAGAVNTYNNNGGQNLGVNSANLANLDNFLENQDAWSSNFVTVPNVITIPICTGDTALLNWGSTGLNLQSYDKRGAPGLVARDDHPPGWPCSTPPDPSSFK